MVFLEKDPPVGSIERITLMMRGIADPLASAYAHLYLARRGQVLLPSDSGLLMCEPPTIDALLCVYGV